VRYRNHGGLSRIGMTKKFLFAAATFATVLAGPAIAADMLVKAPPPPLPPAYSWTGFYLGGNFGYSWGISDPNVNFFDASQFIIASPGGSFKLDGVLGGGQAGYNRQTGNWIWGLEADFQGSGQRGSRTYTCAAGVCSTTGLPVNETVSQQLDWFGTVRGRARLCGYAADAILCNGRSGLWRDQDRGADLRSRVVQHRYVQDRMDGRRRHRGPYRRQLDREA